MNEFEPTFPSAPSRPPARRGSFVSLFMLLILLVLVVSLPYTVENVRYGFVRGQLRAQADFAAQELARLDKTAELVTLSDTSRAFRLVAERVEPCVVHIDTEQLTQRPRRAMFDDYGNRAPSFYRSEGQGSGVIIDSAGYILTNFHVVQNASRIEVHLSDGRTIDAVEIVGEPDPITDVAVLKINATGLIAAEWGDSEQLAPGDWVLAIGNPYGLDRTVTAGIVSSRERRIAGEFSRFRDFLQTDAAVNPGNSGGPLVNIRGQVVGINTAIIGEAFQGISFAIPSRVARDIYEKIRTQGEVVRGFLGIGLGVLTPDIARQLGAADTAGVVVTSVLPGGPAAKAGLEPGDIIVEWDGQAATDVDELILWIGACEVGKNVPMKILRQGQPRSLEVNVGRRPRNLTPR